MVLNLVANHITIAIISLLNFASIALIIYKIRFLLTNVSKNLRFNLTAIFCASLVLFYAGVTLFLLTILGADINLLYFPISSSLVSASLIALAGVIYFKKMTEAVK